jgi:hypothetical protein
MVTPLKNAADSLEHDLFGLDTEDQPIAVPRQAAGPRSFDLKDLGIRGEGGAPFLSSFLIEFIEYLKTSLGSIKAFAHLSIDKLDDVEFRRYFYKVLTEDVKKIDSVLNGLRSYIDINTPIKKTNTIHFLLEGILEEYESQLTEKKIRVFKKFEKDLPETILHDQQLKYILGSVLQYAIFSTQSGGSIGFLTKSLDVEKGEDDRNVFRQKDGKYVEILIVFTGYQKGIERFTGPSSSPPVQKEEAINLLLMLVRELVQRNRGILKFRVNEKRPRTIVSLAFPAERRKLIYYPPMNT